MISRTWSWSQPSAHLFWAITNNLPRVGTRRWGHGPSLSLYPPLPSLHHLLRETTSLLQVTFNRDMANQSRFGALFESALPSYEKEAGVNLAEHPLALQLQSCHSAESIIAVLQGQAQAFSRFQGSDRVMKTIKSTISILTRLSATAPLDVDIDLVCLQALMASSILVALTDFTAISARERNTRWSRYPARRMFHCLRTYEAILVTSKQIRQPRAWLPAMVQSLTSLS